jgi:hypothetical protein
VAPCRFTLPKALALASVAVGVMADSAAGPIAMELGDELMPAGFQTFVGYDYIPADGEDAVAVRPPPSSFMRLLCCILFYIA